MEARDAWKRGDNAEAELRRVWDLVGELGAKLEAQGDSFNELIREIEWTRQRVHDLEAAVAQAEAGKAPTHGSQPE